MVEALGDVAGADFMSVVNEADVAVIVSAKAVIVSASGGVREVGVAISRNNSLPSW